MNNNDAVKTILILAANPSNTAPLRLNEEIREIDEGLRRANQRHQYKLKQKWAVRCRDFYRAILDYHPQIVHFCGHGAGQDGIVLEDDTGKKVLLETKTLASMFKLFAKKSVECVILNACYSEVQAEAISQYVDYVLGMKKAVGDEAAISFSVAFYDALGAGYEVEEAYELGCSQMMNFLEHETPVLKKKPLIPTPISTDIPVFDDVIPPNPYQGLAAFEEEDVDFFFGQENFVNKLVEVTQNQPLVGIIGPSGSGKSSVVFAGLIPELRKQGNWLIEVFRPGEKPFLPLADALVRQLEPEVGKTQLLRESAGLASDFQQGRIAVKQVISHILEQNSGKRLLLVADQLEELYTLCQVKEEREHFAGELLEAISQENITVVFTLRADFYGYVLSYRPFRDALQEYTPQLLSSMKREELQAAIELPAQKLEVELEEQLTHRILDDVGQEPGNLPLLEFALTRLWEKQKNRTLTHQAYQEIGGVKKAIANHAEEVYQKLSKTEKQQAQRIFVQLVRPGEGTEDTRRVATRAEVGEENWNLVSYLAGYKARLVVTGRQETEDTVEVVHEALIREWLRLREWMNADRQFRTWQERLKLSLREWKNNHYELEGLLTGTPLLVAEDWLQKRADEMTQDERNFIQVSAQEAQRRRRLTMRSLIVFSVIALGLAGVASVGWWNAGEANKAILAQSLSNKAFRLQNSFPQRSLLLAIESTKLGILSKMDAWELLQSLLGVIGGIPLVGHEKPVVTVEFTPDGKWLATGSKDGTVRLWNKSDPNLRPRILPGRIGEIKAIAISPDNRWLAAIGDKSTEIQLWNLTSTQSSPDSLILKGHTATIKALSFSHDSTWLVTGSDDRTVRLWNMKTEVPGTKPIVLKGHGASVTQVVFSPYGKWLATGEANFSDYRPRLWDMRKISDTSTPIILQAEPVLENIILKIAFSHDEQRLAAAISYSVEVWDLTTVTPSTKPTVFKGPGSWFDTLAFSSDGRWLAAGGGSGDVKLWDMTRPDYSDGEILLKGHKGVITDLKFSPDSHWLITASSDYTARKWDLSQPTFRSSTMLRSHEATINAIAVSFDSQWLATVSDDNQVRLWNLFNPLNNPIIYSTENNSSVAVAMSDDGKWVAVAGTDFKIRLWKKTNSLYPPSPLVLSGPNENIRGLTFSHNGRWLASVSDDGTGRLWNMTDANPATNPIILQGHKEAISVLAISPDDHWLATGSWDKTIRLWDLSAVDPSANSRILTGHRSAVRSLAFSQDGKYLVSGSGDNLHTADDTFALVWDMTATDPSAHPTQLTGHQDIIVGVDISRDNRWVATAGWDSTARLWDLTSKNPSAKPKVIKFDPIDRVFDVVFSRDGHYLAARSWNNQVQLQDMTQLTQNPYKLLGHRGRVLNVKFSPNSQWLATASEDNTIRLWNPKKPTLPPIILEGHNTSVNSLAFSSDSHWLLSGSADARLWSLNQEALITVACYTAGRNLTRQEWQDFLPKSYQPTCPALSRLEDARTTLKGFLDK